MFLEVRQRRPPPRPQAQYHYRYAQVSLSLDDGSDNKERYPSSPSGLFETVSMAVTTWDRTGRRRRMLHKYRTYLFLMLAVCYATTRSFLAPWYKQRQPQYLIFVGRQRSLERLVITLRYNDRTIHMPRPREVLQESPNNPDYDGLSFNWLEDFDLGRSIAFTDASDYETVHGALLDTMNKHFVESQYYHDDEVEVEKGDTCRRNNWQRKVSPNCNDFHISALERPLDGWNGQEEQGVEIKFLGQGWFRAVWLLESPILGTSVLKRIHLHDRFPLDHIDYYNVHRDAIIMESLTYSPRIVDIYGHCGFSIFSEAMKGEITSDMMYKTGFINPQELHDADEVRPLNNFTVDQKLHIALEMAESVADLHGYEGGVIVHGDVHPVQWLWSADGTLKLNDFNNAEILDWNGTDYCKRYRFYGGMYRAPEEFRGGIVDEKMDVFSMGNNIYVLLTGLFPFYHLNSYEEIQKKVINGTRPFVDERYRTRSFGERSMIEIMEQCWEYDPTKRPDIFDVVRFLRKTIEENNGSIERL